MATVARRGVRCPLIDVWETAGVVGREGLAVPPTASGKGAAGGQWRRRGVGRPEAPRLCVGSVGEGLP